MQATTTTTENGLFIGAHFIINNDIYQGGKEIFIVKKIDEDGVVAEQLDEQHCEKGKRTICCFPNECLMSYGSKIEVVSQTEEK